MQRFKILFERTTTKRSTACMVVEAPTEEAACKLAANSVEYNEENLQWYNVPHADTGEYDKTSEPIIIRSETKKVVG